jgi:hypothetical protein
VKKTSMCKLLPLQAQRHIKEAGEEGMKEKARKAEEGPIGNGIIHPSEEKRQAEWTSFIVLCPTCQTTKEVGRSNLRMKGAWNGLKCKKCEHMHKASKWWCLCGQAWIGCHIHFHTGIKCKGQHSVRPMPNKAKDISRPAGKDHQRKTGKLGDKAKATKNVFKEQVKRRLRHPQAPSTKRRKAITKPPKEKPAVSPMSNCTSSKQKMFAGSKVLQAMLLAGRVEPSVVKEKFDLLGQVDASRRSLVSTYDPGSQIAPSSHCMQLNTPLPVPGFNLWLLMLPRGGSIGKSP